MPSIRENIKTLLEERATLWETTGKPLADIAVTRDFTADETVKFEAAEEGLRGFNDRIQALRVTAEQEQQIAEFSRALDNEPGLRSAIEAELRCVLAERTKVGTEFEFTGRDMRTALEGRALSVGTATAGGNTVPQSFLAELITPLRNFVTVLDAGARVLTTSSGENLTVPRVNGFGTAAQAAEAAALAGTDPSFNQIVLSAFKHGELLFASRELMQDSAFDVEGFVIDLIGQNIGISLGQRLSTGTGTGQTLGIFNAATVGVTGATGVGGAANFDNLIDLQYSVAAPYRANGSWLVADTALSGLRKQKDGTNNYLWQPSVQVGQPDLLLGKPMVADPYATVALGGKSILFGDISKYWVRFVNTLAVERSDHAAFANDQVAFRGILRADGALTDASAVKSFAGGAS